MKQRVIHIAVVTDEVSRTLSEALEVSMEWGLRRFELREGGTNRFPAFTREEISEVEKVLEAGARITAVSPGIFKGFADDEARTRHELDATLPRAIEMAVRFGCDMMIAFGFQRSEAASIRNRLRAMKSFELAAEQVTEAGMIVAIENEPDFWIDQAAESAALITEIGHPGLKLNWDPANLDWGGHVPTHDDFMAVLPYLANLHVKDFDPTRPKTPWLPVGEGTTPWSTILPWIVHETELDQVTLETHCEPLKKSSRRSLKNLKKLLEKAVATAAP